MKKQVLYFDQLSMMTTVLTPSQQQSVKGGDAVVEDDMGGN